VTFAGKHFSGSLVVLDFADDLRHALPQFQQIFLVGRQVGFGASAAAG